MKGEAIELEIKVRDNNVNLNQFLDKKYTFCK